MSFATWLAIIPSHSSSTSPSCRSKSSCTHKGKINANHLARNGWRAKSGENYWQTLYRWHPLNLGRTSFVNFRFETNASNTS